MSTNILIVEHPSYADGKPSVFLQEWSEEKQDYVREELVCTCATYQVADTVGILLSRKYGLGDDTIMTLN